MITITPRVATLLIALVALILISGGTLILALRSATRQESSALFPIIKNGKYGYIDQAGKVIIKPQFDTARRSSEGLARVKVGGKWGFIDHTGKVIIQPQFELQDDNHGTDSSLDFHEGMAAVSLDKGTKWGYIDQTGKMIIAPKYGTVYRFSEGLAEVHAEGPYATIVSESFNRSPEPVVHSWYIDKTGKLLRVPFVGYTFSEGLAVVSVGNAENHKEGYIDKTGRIRIEPQFSIARSFREGLACVRPMDTNEWGYIDKTGKMVIQPRSIRQERGPGDFYEGLASMMLLSKDTWGFIDTTGKFAIEPVFLVVGRFSDGVAGACIEDQSANSGKGGATCGYISRNGKWIIQNIPATGLMTDFYEGLALVCSEDFCGYINKKGDYVWRTTEEFDPRDLSGCTVWNLGDPDYGDDSCRH